MNSNIFNFKFLQLQISSTSNLFHFKSLPLKDGDNADTNENSQKCLSVQVPASSNKSPERVDAFGESVSDDLKVKEIIEKKTRNKLYDVFVKTPPRIRTESGRIISGLATPVKRKVSSDMLQDTPSPKQSRTVGHHFISPSFGGGASRQDRALSTSRHLSVGM